MWVLIVFIIIGSLLIIFSSGYWVSILAGLFFLTIGIYSLYHVLKPVKTIKNAMKKSYYKHFKLQMENKLSSSDDPPHKAGLFGALATRNKVMGISYDEISIWLELLPFLEMNEKDALETLCIYVAFREAPEKISNNDMSFLKSKINEVVENIINDYKKLPYLVGSLKINPKWSVLLSKESIEKLNS